MTDLFIIFYFADLRMRSTSLHKTAQCCLKYPHGKLQNNLATLKAGDEF